MLRRSRLALALTVILVALAPTARVDAHGEDPWLEIEPARLAPGMPLTVRGHSFAFESTAVLTLVGVMDRAALAEVDADVEGAFTYTFPLPADFPAGDYFVEATSGEHVVHSAAFVVSGTPAAPDPGDGVVGEGDSLLGPMPTAAAPSSVPAAASPPDTAAAAAPVPETEDGPVNRLPWVAGGLLLVGVALAATFVVRRAPFTHARSGDS